MRYKSIPTRNRKAPRPKNRSISRRKMGPIPGMRSVRRIERYIVPQDKPSIPRLAFKRLCLDILFEYGQWKLEERALDALQHAGEDFLTGLFRDATLCTSHAKRVTMTIRDLHLAKRLRGSD